VAETWRVCKLDVDIRYEDHIPIIVARGECDLLTCRKLNEAIDNLISTGHCMMVFDLREMTYIDSAGFRALLAAKNRVAEKGGDIAVVSLTAPVERAFELLRIGELVTRTDTVREAVEKLKTIECK